MQMNFKLSFFAFCTLIAFFTLNNAFAVENVDAVSGNCRKALYEAAEGQLNTDDHDFEFNGFYDEFEPEGDNHFGIGYGFNEECSGGLTFKIRPLKVISKNGELHATECRIIDVKDSGVDCG